MEILGQKKLWSFHAGNPTPTATSNYALRSDSGHVVSSFIDLSSKVAELQFRNRDYVLLYRGQGNDHRNNKNNSTLKPSLFRLAPGKKVLSANDVATRYDRLKRAVELLMKAYTQRKFLGRERLLRQRVLRWSILQHYEVCATPLLDVTHSLRIAISFAYHSSPNDEAFLFVVAVPNVSGAITASAEAGVQIMRLSSVCPPAALRPHIQEGYLLGEYPDLVDIQQKGLYMSYEIDFAQRLIGKFKFAPKQMVGDINFPLVNESALYPNADDPLYKLTRNIKNQLGPDPTLGPNT